MNILIPVDPKSKFDLDQAQELIDLFRKQYHSSYSNYSSTSNTNNTNLSKDNSEEINALKEKVSKYELKIESLEKEKTDLANQIKSYKDREEEFKEIEKLYYELDDDNKKLRLENSRLKTSLKDYEKNTILEELIPYAISTGSILTRSNFDDEPFIAKIDYKADKADFKFNSQETKKHSDFISNRGKLETFCEILSEMESANFIEHADWGQGQYHNTNESIVVTKKAKVNLIKI